MYLAEMTKLTAAQGQTSFLLMGLFLFGLATMAWLTFREASLYETKSAIRSLRRNRKPAIPSREKIHFLSHCNLFVRNVIRGGEITDTFTQVVGEGEYGFEYKLRHEIDKLVGKEVYHGQKEQL